jgi:hypothetical protein
MGKSMKSCTQVKEKKKKGGEKEWTISVGCVGFSKKKKKKKTLADFKSGRTWEVSLNYYYYFFKP